MPTSFAEYEKELDAIAAQNPNVRANLYWPLLIRILILLCKKLEGTE